jgi:hypothetical protein
LATTIANSVPTTISHHGASGGKARAISQAVTTALPSLRNRSERLAAQPEHQRFSGQRGERGNSNCKTMLAPSSQMYRRQCPATGRSAPAASPAARCFARADKEASRTPSFCCPLRSGHCVQRRLCLQGGAARLDGGDFALLLGRELFGISGLDGGALGTGTFHRRDDGRLLLRIGIDRS